MSSSIDNSVTGSSQAVDQTAAVQTPSTTATPGYTAATQVSSMTDLKTKAPVVYKAMLFGIASSMMSQQQRQSDHLKAMIKEGEDNPNE